MIQKIRRLLDDLGHWFRADRMRRCPDCHADTWHRIEGVNPIHEDGPPFYFTWTCLDCGKVRNISSGIFEEAASRMVERGECTEDQAADKLTMILGPKTMRDTYLEDEDE